MTVLMHFRSINQVMKYKETVTSPHRKTVFKTLKIVLIQILFIRSSSLPITSTVFQSFAFWTVLRVHWLKHDLYFTVLSNKELHHTDRSGNTYQYAKLHAPTILWNYFPASTLGSIYLWLCPTQWNFNRPLQTRSCDATSGWHRVNCAHHGALAAF